MKKFAGILLLSVAARAMCQDFVSNEVLVKYAPGQEVYASAANAAFGGTVIQTVGADQVQRVRLGSGKSVNAALAWYRSLPGVECAEPNFKMKATHTPNDTFFTSQWGAYKASLPAAWELSQSNLSVFVAVLDTGVDYTHPDLQNKVVEGYDFVNNDADAMDDHGHGTHCAGIIAATPNNSMGIAGVGYNARVMPIKVLDSQGSGSYAAAIQAIDWAIASGAKVISMSFGGSGSSTLLNDAVTRAWNAGVLVVAAAGNDGTTTQFYPAACEKAIAVGSSNQSDARSSFSNYGSWVDVAAPGEQIVSTVPGGQYSFWSGTSMATPFVAGVGALVWDKLGNGTTVSMVREKIESTATNVGSWVANGRVNAEAALTTSAPPPPPPPPAPTEVTLNPASFLLARGEWLSGTLNSVQSSDDNRFAVGGSQVSTTTTRVLDLNLTFMMTGDTVFNVFEFTFEHSSSLQGTAYVKIYNFANRRWDSLTSLSMRTTDRVSTKRLTNAWLKYRSSTGEVRIAVQRTTRGAFGVGLDHVKLRATK